MTFELTSAQRKRLRGLAQPSEGELAFDRSATQAVVHRPPVEQLHDYERSPCVLADIEYRDHVAVPGELCGRERFAPEPRVHVRITCMTRREHLDGNCAAQNRVGRTVHLPHAATRDERAVDISRGQDVVGCNAGDWSRVPASGR